MVFCVTFIPKPGKDGDLVEAAEREVDAVLLELPREAVVQRLHRPGVRYAQPAEEFVALKYYKF